MNGLFLIGFVITVITVAIFALIQRSSIMDVNVEDLHESHADPCMFHDLEFLWHETCRIGSHAKCQTVAEVIKTAVRPAVIDINWMVRERAIRVLGRLGYYAADCLTLLRRKRNDVIWEVRHAAAAAVREIESELY